MLLSKSSKPERSLYYGGGMVIEVLLDAGGELPLPELFNYVKGRHDMTAQSLIMCLDWLYLAGAVFVDEKGVAHICI